MERIIVWIDASARVNATELTNGGASIPPHPKHSPTNQTDKLASWLDAGWRIHSVGGVILGMSAATRLPTETLVTVLEHD